MTTLAELQTEEQRTAFAKRIVDGSEELQKQKTSIDKNCIKSSEELTALIKQNKGQKLSDDEITSLLNE